MTVSIRAPRLSLGRGGKGRVRGRKPLVTPTNSIATLPAPPRIAAPKPVRVSAPRAAPARVPGVAGATVRPARRGVLGRRRPRYTVVLSSLETMFSPLEIATMQAERARDRAERRTALRVLALAVVGLCALMVALAVLLVRAGAAISSLMS